MRRPVFIALLIMLLCTFSSALQDAGQRSPSTKEERDRFLTVVHKLEQDPLDKSLDKDAKWALDWLRDIPDININICPLILGDDFAFSHYKYSARLLGLGTLASAAYIIEHPNKASDTVAQYTAGAESALKAYKAILKTEPTAQSRTLEDLLEKQSQGKLPDFVRESTKNCDDKAQGM